MRTKNKSNIKKTKCVHCGTIFTQFVSENKKYCSAACFHAARKKYSPEFYNKISQMAAKKISAKYNIALSTAYKLKNKAAI